MPQLNGPALVAVGVPGEVHTTAKNPVGTIQVYEGQEYIYLKGVAATIAGAWVTFDEAFLTALMDTDTAATIVGPVAIATAAIVANTWGWYLRSGSISAGAGDVADNARVFATSTAGVCDDAAVNGAQVLGAIWRGEDASSLALVQIQRPWIGSADTT
jgi:hypothetical protein